MAQDRLGPGGREEPTGTSHSPSSTSARSLRRGWVPSSSRGQTRPPKGFKEEDRITELSGRAETRPAVAEGPL